MVDSKSQIAPPWGHLDLSVDAGIQRCIPLLLLQRILKAILAPELPKGSPEASVETASQFKFTLCLIPFPHFCTGVVPKCLPTGLLCGHSFPFPFASRVCSPEIQPET